MDSTILLSSGKIKDGFLKVGILMCSEDVLIHVPQDVDVTGMCGEGEVIRIMTEHLSFTWVEVS